MERTPIQKLIACDGDIPALLVCAREYARCGEQTIAPLLRNRDIHHILKLYLDGAIKADDVVEWADFFDVCDNVDFEHEDTASHLFLLSSPEINAELTPERAESLRRNLVQ